MDGIGAPWLYWLISQRCRGYDDIWWLRGPGSGLIGINEIELEEEYIRGGSVIEAFWRTVTYDLSLIDRSYLAGHLDRRDIRIPRRAAGLHPTTAEEETEIREGMIDAPPPKTVLEKLGERWLFVT